MRGTLAAVGEGGAHDVVLPVDAEEATPYRHQVVLELEFAAAEHRVALGIDGLLELAAFRSRGLDAGCFVAGLAGQPSEDEAVKAGVVGGQLEPERPHGATDAGFDRVRDLDLEIGIADVEGLGRVVHAAREQFGRFRGALDILAGQAADQVPGQVLDQTDAGALRREA